MISEFTEFIRSLAKDSYNDYFLEPGDIHNDVISLCENESKLTFVDGGAHEGETIERVLNYYPDTEIHAFEPINEKATILKQKYREDEDIHIYDFALGASEKEAELNILESTSSSSLHNPTGKKSKLEVHHTIDRKEQVEQVRLSNYVDNIDILKLDLQGGELNALKGVDNIECIDMIMLEMRFLKYYENQPSFCDLHEYLKTKEFKLYNVYSVKRGRVSTTSSGKIKGCDGLYINNNIHDNL